MRLISSPYVACLVGAAALAAVVVFPGKAPDFVWPDSAEYTAMATGIAQGEGFRVGIVSNLPRERQPGRGVRVPSRYPPGYPVALAPFALAFRERVRGVQLGARVLAGLYLVALFGCAWLLRGPPAAAAVAVLTAGSPFLATSSRLVMADAFGAALAISVAAMLEARAGRGARRAAAWTVAAGMLAGASVLVRTANLVVPLALLAALKGRKDRLLASLGVLPGFAALAAYQWSLYGRPWITGYGYWFPTIGSFSLANVFRSGLPGDGPWVYPDLLHGLLMSWLCPCPQPGGPMAGAANLLFYPAVLLGLFWVFLPPLVPVFAVGLSLRERSRGSVRYLMWLVAANLVLVLPYGYSAARLVAPAASALLVLSAAGMSALAVRTTRTGRSSAETPTATGTGLTR